MKKIEKEKTSVMWLIEKLKEELPSPIIESLQVHFDTAIEMNMNQIMSSHRSGFLDAYGFPFKQTAEEYYNQKYGTD